MQRKDVSVKRVILAEGYALPVEEKHFDQIINTESKAVLVDFWADWCGPCQYQAPILDEFAAKFADQVQVIKVEAEKAPLLMHRFNITGLPTLMLFKEGKPVETIVGVRELPQLQKDLASYIGLETKQDIMTPWWDDIPVEMLGDHPPLDSFIVKPKEVKNDEDE